MSVDAGLEIRFGANTTVGGILRHLLDAGWLGADKSSIEVFSLEDEAANVSLKIRSLEEDASALDLRLSGGGSFAVTMTWNASGVGGEFIFSLRDHVTFSPTINRVTLGRRLTDASWYLTRIIPRDTGPVVATWAWRESG